MWAGWSSRLVSLWSVCVTLLIRDVYYQSDGVLVSSAVTPLIPQTPWTSSSVFQNHQITDLHISHYCSKVFSWTQVQCGDRLLTVYWLCETPTLTLTLTHPHPPTSPDNQISDCWAVDFRVKPIQLLWDVTAVQATLNAPHVWMNRRTWAGLFWSLVQRWFCCPAAWGHRDFHKKQSRYVLVFGIKSMCTWRVQIWPESSF